MTPPLPEAMAREACPVWERNSSWKAAYEEAIRDERARIAAEPDAAWAAAVVAEADRIEAEPQQRPPYDDRSPTTYAGDRCAQAAGALSAPVLNATERVERALHAAAWALVLDRRARAVKP